MQTPFSGTHLGWTQPDVVWEQLLRPWFAACACIGWEPAGSRGEPVLLAPDAGFIAWVKGCLVAENIGCLGVHFHTAGTLRGHLARAYGIEAKLALREDLHLLMGQAARSLPDNPVAQATAIDPAMLTRLCDRLDEADWRKDGFATAAGCELAHRYFDLLAAQGLRTAADLEREILQRAQAAPQPACGYLLAAGFGAEHSARLPLLRAAVLSAAEPPILCLDSIPDGSPVVGGAAALAWQASCEEFFGTAQPLDADEPVATNSAPAATDELSAQAGATFADTGADAFSATAGGAFTRTGALFADGEDDEAVGGSEASARFGEGGSAGLLNGSVADAKISGGTVTDTFGGSEIPADTRRAALAQWAQAFGAHRSMDAALRGALQSSLRLLVFRSLGDEAESVVAHVADWLEQHARTGKKTADNGSDIKVTGQHPRARDKTQMLPCSSSPLAQRPRVRDKTDQMAEGDAADWEEQHACTAKETEAGNETALAESTGFSANTAGAKSDRSAASAKASATVAAPLRIGVILPEGGHLLGREIAARLAERGIAHYDSLGHHPARTAPQRLLEGWCAWQTSNQLDDFSVFLSDLVGEGILGARTQRRWEQAAAAAFTHTLCAELNVIAAWIAAQPASGGSGTGRAFSGGSDSGAGDGFSAGSGTADSGDSTQNPSGRGGVIQSRADGGGVTQNPSGGGVAVAAQGSAEGNDAVEVLAQWPSLPAQAPFAAFWEQALPVLKRFGWPERLEPLELRAAEFARTLGGNLPRTAFIAWLRAVTKVPGRTRNACGHEPFAPVHIVTVAEASRQHWSHLCMAGMVHGLWPPVQTDSALLDDARCAALNRRAERPSRFGDGQSFIGGAHTYLASARDGRELFNAAFLRLIAASGAGVFVLSRHRFEPSASQAELFASEYFMRACYAAAGILEVAQEAEGFLENAPPAEAAAPLACDMPDSLTIPDAPDPVSADRLTAADGQAPCGGLGGFAGPDAPPMTGKHATPYVLRERAGVPAARKTHFSEVAEAYRRRRDPATAFDAWSYVLCTPPPLPLRLSCSHWAEAIARPAHAWYRYLLRVKKRVRASETDIRRQSQGIWVHRWLNPSVASGGDTPFGETAASLADGFMPRPPREDWQRQVAARADGLRRAVEAAYVRAGRQLPQWWQSDWSAAAAMATGLAAAVGIPAEAAQDSDFQPDGVPRSDFQPDGDDDGKSGAAANDGSAIHGWPVVAGEWKLPAVCLVWPGHPLDGLVLEGVIDLLLATDPPLAERGAAGSGSGAYSESGAAANGDDTVFPSLGAAVDGGSVPMQGEPAAMQRIFGGRSSLWVVDFKTGGDAALSLSAWESRAAGLQLVLYALGLRALGAQAVQMSLLKKDAALLPQLSLEELGADAPVWRRLALPMRYGVFGMLGPLRDRHAFVGDYPIATLAIDPSVLQRKAALTLVRYGASG